ncbi:hypothetical protein AB0H73_29925 [Streptomyces olivoreticuli]
MYKDVSTAQLAAPLEALPESNPHMTGAISLLDQASMRFAARYPSLADRQRAFSKARAVHWPYRGMDNWAEVVKAGLELAAALRPLGSAVLDFCDQLWEDHDYPCPGVLDEQGACPFDHAHRADTSAQELSARREGERGTA